MRECGYDTFERIPLAVGLAYFDWLVAARLLFSSRLKKRSILLRVA